MSEYEIPKEYFFRIHHVRPRFKGDIENVLIYFAEELARVGERPVDEFVKEVNNALYRYPGNEDRELKTINNWRTEISALFGFIEHTGYTDKPSRRALELASHQDLVESFKVFLYNFQYPGAHIKPRYVLMQIEAGVHFKPAKYILQLLRYANRDGGNDNGITKFEVCHCIFNDLRVTRDDEGVAATWKRIADNRRLGLDYDQTGDVVRYAGDIVDYMEIANLLVTDDNKTYYLNRLEEKTIAKFCESTEWFSEYDTMIRNRSGSIEAVKDCCNGWFSYVNRDIQNADFSTDILTYIAPNGKELEALEESSFDNDNLSATECLDTEEESEQELQTWLDIFSTKDIGDFGEKLIYGHECKRVKNGGREDLVHLIKQIPTELAVGYDISSVELDERKRYIEVKTTISSKPLLINRIHLTKNEWNTARSIHDRYFIYRLLLSKKERKLILIQGPYDLYEKGKISMVLADGADITFDPNTIGEYEELLTWIR